MLASFILTGSFLILLLTLQLGFAAETLEKTTVISPPSGTGDDQHTTANCPDGYLMIGCSLAPGSSFEFSDGLMYEGNGCRAYARGGRRVQVRIVLPNT